MKFSNITEGDVDLRLELEEPIDPEWLFGTFRLSVAGHKIGDWDDTVTMRTILGAWSSFLSSVEDRWDPVLSELPDDEWFQALEDSAFGEPPETPIVDAYRRFDVTYLGGSALENERIFFAVDLDQTCEWLVWRGHDGMGKARRMPAGTIARVGASIVTTLKSWLP